MRAVALAILLLCACAAEAHDRGPIPPCESGPLPAFPDPDAAPTVQVWNGDQLDPDWTPPACTGWVPPGARVLVALAASFRYDGNGDDLLQRFGAVSALTDIRYWSASAKSWLPLLAHAAALAGPDIALRRPDFTAAEMRNGQDLFLALHDRHAPGGRIHRLRVRENSSDAIVIEMENATAVRALYVTLLNAGDLQSLYYLKRLSPGLWGFYFLSRTRASASPLVRGPVAGYANRAVALYRHYTGIPTDREPPAVP